MTQRPLIEGSPENGSTAEFTPEERLLRQALDIDLDIADPDLAASLIEAAMYACDQLSFVYKTWYQLGPRRDHEAIQRGATTFIRFYDAYVGGEEKERNRPYMRSGSGWAPGQVAAESLRKLLASRWMQVTGQGTSQLETRVKGLYGQEGPIDMKYFLQVEQEPDTFEDYDD